MLFEDIENPDKKDQKLNVLERGVILAAIPLAKLIIWKLKKARTYGDLMKLGNFINKKADEIEEKYSDQEFEDEKSVKIFEEEVSSATSEIEDL